MFQVACRQLQKTVMPIIVSWKDDQDKINSGVGAGIIINEDGWFITAGHILAKICNLEKETQDHTSGNRYSGQATHYGIVFGTTNANLDEVMIQSEIDLGIGVLKGYSPPPNYQFPLLRKGGVEQGELLCRFGYPFIDSDSIFPEWTGEIFEFSNLFPIPSFVNEAMVSRFLGLPSGIWIETSSPGLRGQSGGPLVDTDGLICGIQVNTFPYPLDFEGRAKNQTMNVGRAVHVETIRKALDLHKIPYQTGR